MLMSTYKNWKVLIKPHSTISYKPKTKVIKLPQTAMLNVTTADGVPSATVVAAFR